MVDHWEHQLRFGRLGGLVDRLVVGRYLRRLLIRRNAALQEEAESLSPAKPEPAH